VVLACIRQLDLRRGILDEIVRHHLPATEGLEVARLAVDRHPHFNVFAEALFGRRSDGLLQRTEHHVFLHVLLACQRVDQQQQFAAHVSDLLPVPEAVHSFGTSLALSKFVKGKRCSVPSTSSSNASSLAPCTTPVKRRRPSSGMRNRTSAFSPAKRRKSAGFFRTRSSPGEDTSRRS